MKSLIVQVFFLLIFFGSAQGLFAQGEWSEVLAKAREKEFLFCWFYGISPYQYTFTDDDREVHLRFLSPDTIVVSNSVENYVKLAFVDKYVVKQIEGKVNYCVLKLASSSRSDEQLICHGARLPFRGGEFNNTYEVFPVLQSNDTIFMSLNLKNIQIKEFCFQKTSDSYNDYIMNGYKLKPAISPNTLEFLMKEYHKQKRENGKPWAIDAILPYCDEKYLKCATGTVLLSR